MQSYNDIKQYNDITYNQINYLTNNLNLSFIPTQLSESIRASFFATIGAQFASFDNTAFSSIKCFDRYNLNDVMEKLHHWSSDVK